MKKGDTFLFSSKTIPGNERGVIQIMNAFSEKGVKVVDDENGRYHVSGHPNRPDLEAMHNLIQPELVVPMHGEHRHLSTHVELAERLGRKAALVTNGMRVVLDAESPEVVEHVETGRTYLDGSVQIGALDGVVRDRIRMALNGLVVVTLIMDEDDEPLGDPWVEMMGLPETGNSKASVSEVMEADLAQFLARAEPKTLTDDDALEEALRRAVRKTALEELGRKPEVVVVVSRLS